jgi:hypothetical protein
MSFFGLFKPQAIRCGEPEWHGLEFDIDDLCIPEPIRELVARNHQPGYSLYFHDTELGGEWWLLDADNLVDAYWLK